MRKQVKTERTGNRKLLKIIFPNVKIRTELGEITDIPAEIGQDGSLTEKNVNPGGSKILNIGKIERINLLKSQSDITIAIIIRILSVNIRKEFRN